MSSLYIEKNRVCYMIFHYLHVTDFPR